MGRMHSKGKGKSRSSLPYKRSPASWLKTTANEARARTLLSELPLLRGHLSLGAIS